MRGLVNMVPILLAVLRIGGFVLRVFLDLKAGPFDAAGRAAARPDDLICMMSPEWNMRGAAKCRDSPALCGALVDRPEG